VLWNDKELSIDWKLPENDVVLSEKDKIQATFADKNF
ncbi:MAG: dTDP-4-dehydrorhamnose 3,5-epimerase family protein, partial [Chryseobacterium sp.]|nr:dTDP-4-dehydrorhamnose 3,5-epimerase family protein [Chryseobacterium sp.]